MLIATLSLSALGQAPEGFKYQAVVRDAGNLILNNQAVGMRLTIQQGSIGGVTVYSETFSTTTNGYGLVNLEIGTGTTAYDFSTIDWGNGPYFMETAVDVTGGTSYAVMGTSQLMSVPYALHSKTAENVTNDLVDDADADPTNELQDWSNLPGIPAGLADGTDDVDDADADPTNELQDWSSLPGIPSGLSDGTDDVDDADSDPTNELQDWSNLPGIPAELADGTDDVDDADADPTNELQDWSSLPGIPSGLSDGTDDVDDADSDPTNELQDWSNLPGIPAELADGTDDVDDADADPTNELQALNLSNDTLYLSDGNGVYIGGISGSSNLSVNGNEMSSLVIPDYLSYTGDCGDGSVIVSSDTTLDNINTYFEFCNLTNDSNATLDLFPLSPAGITFTFLVKDTLRIEGKINGVNGLAGGGAFPATNVATCGGGGGGSGVVSGIAQNGQSNIIQWNSYGSVGSSSLFPPYLLSKI